MQYVGAGKVLFHATDDTWRWRYRVGDVFFARYWVQTVRYLSRSKLLGKDHAVELTADRREYRRGEPVRLRAAVHRRAPGAGRRRRRDRRAGTRGTEESADQAASATRPTAASSKARWPTRWTASYHAWVATPTLEGKAPVGRLSGRGAAGRVGARADGRRRIEARGRRDARTLLSHRPTSTGCSTICRRATRCRSKRCRPRCLWNRWWLLATFLGLIVSEWILRKRKGML